jgi:hypothetical protein
VDNSQKAVAQEEGGSEKDGGENEGRRQEDNRRENGGRTEETGSGEKLKRGYGGIRTRGTGSAVGEQSGDLQGSSNVQRADSESVDELLEQGNAFEAEVVKGVEDDGGH